MIEPSARVPSAPVHDDVTRAVESLLASATFGRRYRGVHECACGATSDNREWFVVVGDRRYLTNSLALHYVRDHRNEVPASEIAKLGLAVQPVGDRCGPPADVMAQLIRRELILGR